ncbi:translation factor GTPase family protein [Hungatella effluvii]|uniref:translation factor GTPase family protein n=1 Tax=Hungatella effluvii TaxID=1096246 RepID=UPI0022E87F0C|nr:TetM/TetW/TetO/TetS family tetracycline resistance ribosomal protection protein [Hungatella effluvii]
MKKLAVGILAHVDAGKTTLSEAMLYMGGSIRKMGRVDRGDAFLDTYELEKKRGITIFSKQAILKWKDMEMTLLDTPGHVDFSAEMERTLQVLDYAILVISGTDGVQEHTRTLWRLLARYRVPTFLFINKMDLAGLGKGAILDDLRKVLKETFVDFGEAGTDHFYEQIAMTSEERLDEYLETGRVEAAGIREQIINRRLFPCFFGSALKFTGVEEFMKGLEEYTETPEYPQEFGAKIFKISRDAQGNRMSHMKITGGSLLTREIIDEEKVNQIRLYSGEKFETVREAPAGTVCAVLGLAKTVPGQGLGIEAASAMPLLEPVMTYRIGLPEGVDAAAVLPKFRELEEEDPELHLTWEESKKEIHVQIMGEIQMEILKSVIEERFGLSVEFGDRSIVYRETITNTVEGVGHFEPLRHYAEVHLLLEPGEPGSGMQFASACSEDILGRNWQRLVLTHLAEKEHKGVLTGSSVTDMKITLMSGRAHLKHTEGGDFRQAVYRAVRQGLMQAESMLLEPFYDFRLELPDRYVGRAMSDVERMAGKVMPPVMEGDRAVLTGSAPAACMGGYQKEVTAYTGGAGRLSFTFSGYGPCHNTEEVVAAIGYDPDGDTANPAGSVFCAHGAGFLVEWDQVPEYMHLESCLEPQKDMGADGLAGAAARKGQAANGRNDEPESDREWIGTEEVDAILERTFYANRRGNSSGAKSGWKNREKSFRIPVTSVPAVRTYKKEAPREEYLLVDGYNIIFAWDELKELAEQTIDGARGKLLDILCNYQGMKKCRLIAVFDAYRVQGHVTECLDYHNIQVVFTKEAETADQYIEKFAHENGRKYDVTVATSDHLEQIIIHGQGCRLISARELKEEIHRLSETVHQEYQERKTGEKHKNYLLDSVSEEMMKQIKELPEE